MAAGPKLKKYSGPRASSTQILSIGSVSFVGAARGPFLREARLETIGINGQRPFLPKLVTGLFSEQLIADLFAVSCNADKRSLRGPKGVMTHQMLLLA